MSDPEYALREDLDQPGLFLMGPYDHGADQLRVNGYSFIGKPDDILVELLTGIVPVLISAAERFGLAKPTIYFVAHTGFPKRIAAFVGESSHDPMIVLMEQRLIQEILADQADAPSARRTLIFLERILIHELAHAYVEAQLGDALHIPERQVLRFEERYAAAVASNSPDQIVSALDAWREYVRKFPT